MSGDRTLHCVYAIRDSTGRLFRIENFYMIAIGTFS